MIPVITMNNDGELSYQVLNDNLTPVEQINRKLLATLTYAQTKLVNERDAFSKRQGKAGYTDKELDNINKAATTLMDAVKAAIDVFSAEVAKVGE